MEKVNFIDVIQIVTAITCYFVSFNILFSGNNDDDDFIH